MYRLILNFHLALGLIITPFLIIFAISSLFISHSFVDFSSTDKKVEHIKLDLVLTDPSELANLFSKDHGIQGELENHSVDKSGKIKLLIMSPGKQSTIVIDTNTNIATVEHETQDLIGFTKTLHITSGPKSNNSGERYWDIAVLIFAILLICVLATGLLLWFYRSKDRTSGLIFLTVSTAYSIGVLCVLRIG